MFSTIKEATIAGYRRKDKCPETVYGGEIITVKGVTLIRGWKVARTIDEWERLGRRVILNQICHPHIRSPKMRCYREDQVVVCDPSVRRSVIKDGTPTLFSNGNEHYDLECSSKADARKVAAYLEEQTGCFMYVNYEENVVSFMMALCGIPYLQEIAPYKYYRT